MTKTPPSAAQKPTEPPQYRPQEIEKRRQKIWEQLKIGYTQDTVPGKQNFYSLTMLPYPSGDLHIGHWYAYTGHDAFSRFMRMKGYNVSQPIGFDAFGLPAENAAIKRNLDPHDWTMSNIANMRSQLRKMGVAWDWPREVVTCAPEYYKWTQWLFLQMYKHGLAYRTKAPANWCPNCQTTLANEQVVNGKCERCDTEVIRKEIDQWLFRITKYADELLNFDDLNWPEKTIVMQRNWIGRSEGAEVRFTAVTKKETIDVPVFTTRPDTIFGVTFFVIAPEHPLVEKITIPQRKKKVREYIVEASKKSEIERQDTERPKTGVFTGGYVINPANDEKIPVWVADYVLAGYGHGAVMGVPGHDERDFNFARKFGLPIRQVVADENEEMSDPATWTTPKTAYGRIVNSGKFTGLTVEEMKTAIIADLQQRDMGKKAVTYRLRDWLISRQRFWGAPIPIVHCEKDGVVPVPEDQLPVRLPEHAQFKPTGESPLALEPSFRNTTCPMCGGPALREADTMDTFMCSSWYFLRYMDAHNDTAAWDPQKIAQWLPVQVYTGGAEHTTMHLLYARFFVKALRDMGLVNFNEPFQHLFHQGIVLGADSQKMSKSRGNVVAPDSVVDVYSADAVRCYLMFMGPFDMGGPWSPKGVEGVARFLNRIWTMGIETEHLLRKKSAANNPDAATITTLRHKIIKRVSEHYPQFRFNIIIAAMMETLNALQDARTSGLAEQCPEEFTEAFHTLLLLLAPLAPHITDELWSRRGISQSIHTQNWPEYDEELTKDSVITIPIQVNGKLRGSIEVPADATDAVIQTMAQTHEKVVKYISGKEIRKLIYVKGKLINFVV